MWFKRYKRLKVLRAININRKMPAKKDREFGNELPEDVSGFCRVYSVRECKHGKCPLHSKNNLCEKFGSLTQKQKIYAYEKILFKTGVYIFKKEMKEILDGILKNK
jgi:hypothetical protein